MNEIERQIFAAAYAAAFERSWNFYVEAMGVQKAMDLTNGFSAAEVADQAVKKYRAALACDDAEYLLSVSESWPVAT